MASLVNPLSARPRASLETVSTSASATLMHLWLLGRPGVKLSSEELGEALGLSHNTVDKVRQELAGAGLVKFEQDSIVDPYRYTALRGGRFKGWQAKRLELPEAVRALGPTAGAVYLYLAGKPGVTRAQLGEALGVHYQSVVRVLEGLEPYLETAEKNPIKYRLRD